MSSSKPSHKFIMYRKSQQAIQRTPKRRRRPHFTDSSRNRPGELQAYQNETGDVPLKSNIQTLEAENASLQKQLGRVKRKFKCPLCEKPYSRIDALNRHIRGRPDTRHRDIAATIKRTCCLICEEQFTRPDEAIKHELERHGISQSRAELAFALSPPRIGSVEIYQPDTSIHPTNKAQVLNALEFENAASSANLEPVSSISRFNIRTISGPSTEQRGLSNFSNGLELPNSSSSGFFNGLDHLLNGVAGQDSSYPGLSNIFSSWPAEHDDLQGDVAGQSSSSNELSNVDHLLNGVAGQDSSYPGLSNIFSSWPAEHDGLLGGVASSSNELSNVNHLLNGVAGQDSSYPGLSNIFSSWPAEHDGLPDGVTGQSMMGFRTTVLLGGTVPAMDSNGLGGRFFNGLGQPDGVEGDRGYVNCYGQARTA